MTKKCNYCGREGGAPDVRGAKSFGVNIGNYRITHDVDIVVCEECASKFMANALDKLVRDMLCVTTLEG